MEMVSASKMRKAVGTLLSTRLYSTLARELMQHLASINDPTIALFNHRPVERLLAIVVSSNRGLCGSFNSNLFRKAKRLFADKKNLSLYRNTYGKVEAGYAPDFPIDVIAVGKKSVGFAKRQGYDVLGAYDALSDVPTFLEALPIARFALNAFLEKKYDKVVLLFTEYYSSLSQEPKIRQLLPISDMDLEKMLAQFGSEDDEKRSKSSGSEETEEKYPIENYLFEPDIDAIVTEVLPRLVEVQLFQAILESTASEHSARMVAMKSASDNAGEMIDELKLFYNKARQTAITQEIAEIAGGAAALNA